jgi:TatD DNase family protein
MDQYADDLESVLTESQHQGVKNILVPGIDLESSRAAIKLADQHANIYAAVGIHPHDAQQWTPDSRQQLIELAAHPKVVAIGEIGLDYYRNFSPQDIQKTVLRSQLEIALAVKKPVIFHERESADALWQIIKDFSTAFMETFNVEWGVFHSFSGSLSYALRAIEHRLMIGVSGPITYKNALEKQDNVTQLPLETMLLETDGPYLPPHPFRGKRNLPQYIPLIAEKIAALKNCEIEQVRNITTANANKIFSWGYAP